MAWPIMVNFMGLSLIRTSIFVLGDVDVSNVTILAEFAAQRLTVRAVGKIVNFERDHSRNVGRRSTGHRA